MKNNYHLTIDQLVERWGGYKDHKQGVSRNTLAMWRVHGKGPSYIKVGNTVLYPLKDLLEYEESSYVRTKNESVQI